MADVTPILIGELDPQTTLQDTDYFIVGGDDAKKITVAQMKEALGINSLNTNMLKVKVVELSISANANTDANISVDWGLPEEAVFVAYFIERVAGSGNTTNIIYCNFSTSTNIRVKSTTSQTITVAATCLYK